MGGGGGGVLRGGGGGLQLSDTGGRGLRWTQNKEIGDSD